MPFDDAGGRGPGRQPGGRNVLGGVLQPCSRSPLTGFYRTGSCETGPEDRGCHTVCAVMTEDFLAFSRAQGNDLSTPRPEFGFPGLRAGDHWCVCAGRWQEALLAGQAPLVALAATHESALSFCTLDDLRRHAVTE